MYSLKLYSTDSAAVAPAKIDAVLALMEFGGTFKVSRTVGPANWFALNKQELAGEDNVGFPVTDIDYAPYESIAGVSALGREQSVLTISFAEAKSPRMQALNTALQKEVPAEARGFSISSATFSFGPSDIVAWTEDDEGQEDVELVDVARFIFLLSCDRFSGHYNLFAETAPEVPEFVRFRSDLEQIVGPLKLFFPDVFPQG